MAHEKKASWQKNKALGGAISGRSHLATADKVFDRVLSLEMPHPNDTLPLFITDTVPKDLYFPIEEADIRDALDKANANDTAGLTHIWLRRPRASEFRSGRIPLAEYIALEEIALIAFYPWPNHMLMPLTKKPSDAILNRYKRWKPSLTSHKGKWQLQWHADLVRDFCLTELVKHMLAVHTDFRQKHAARESTKRIELPVQYANQRYIEENLVIW